MARNLPENPENIVCRYFLQASCHFGNNCPISHVRSQNCKPDDICRKYLHRRCRDGDKCIYRHARIPIFYKVMRQNGIFSLPHVGLGIENSSKLKENETTTDISCLSKSSVPKELGSDWVNAAEFIPKKLKSYAECLRREQNTDIEELKSKELCYYLIECCPYGGECPYIHGDACDICGYVCLHPYNEQQRIIHREKCLKELEDEMEFSFAVQRSMGKMCGICMDVVIDKERISDRRFGILENCNHVFCLNCIRKWRSAKKFENRQHSEGVLDPFVTRACPECRRPSDFVTPSPFWFENEEEKKKLMEDYKKSLNKRHCKYFKRGEGTCYFGSTCFYLHANPDGTIVKLPPPARRRRRNQNMELDYLEESTLWDFFRTREENILIHLDLDEFLYNMTLPDGDDVPLS
ncbi:probable E3 ubiquitin-protein ligase makorin-1 [Uloborus diversus]|uniref:probable E3 ubiquitin-protein ligase makorin-1 n=1 Tax=Uloborus diversus TaxID=327109 RepID=UPI0024093456|nr:probable E3 ubiquitin-protein ligase makorin-1 [Uloborus diversus]